MGHMELYFLGGLLRYMDVNDVLSEFDSINQLLVQGILQSGAVLGTPQCRSPGQTNRLANSCE
jgi:hypothetical protein